MCKQLNCVVLLASTLSYILSKSRFQFHSIHVSWFMLLRPQEFVPQDLNNPSWRTKCSCNIVTFSLRWCIRNNHYLNILKGSWISVKSLLWGGWDLNCTTLAHDTPVDYDCLVTIPKELSCDLLRNTKIIALLEDDAVRSSLVIKSALHPPWGMIANPLTLFFLIRNFSCY
jgi:hypothetical protein